MRFITDDQIPVGFFQPRLQGLTATDLIQARDDAVMLGKGIR